MSNPLLARYADCIFWLARFVERAENLARILDVNETFSRDSHGGQNWLSIVQLNADEDAFFSRHKIASTENVLRFYVIEADNPTAIVSAVANARENARTLRPLISTEMWVQLNVFYNRLKGLKENALAPGALTPLFAEIKEACQCFTGITEGTFYRDQAWYFYRLGRYIERADQTTRLLDAKYHLLAEGGGRVSSGDIGQWHALLRSASGYHAFRRIYSSTLTPDRVAGFLLFDRSFPRSVYLCLREVEAALTELKSRYALRAGSDVADSLDNLRASLDALTIAQILEAGLHDFIDFVQRELAVISLQLGAAFFGHPSEELRRRDCPEWQPRFKSTQTQSEGRA
ncbi:MAG: alpha-E domain-containing protein [Alphaproteobacteria bacterium]|nr:alpha-E domain-containing protein [Alphaproteobacteria bacterium]